VKDWRSTARRLEKLVALAGSANEHEAARAREHALRLIAGIDLDLVATLDGQRDYLIEACRRELRRLNESRTRPNAETRMLVSSAQMLLSHYRNLDALAPMVVLARQLVAT